MTIRFGTMIAVPNDYSRFARVLDDDSGIGYTIEPLHLPEEIEDDTDVAYKVEIWENDSGLVHFVDED